MPSPSNVIRCEDCGRKLEHGEIYYEKMTARRVVGDPPPVYAAKFIQCMNCDINEAGDDVRQALGG